MDEFLSKYSYPIFTIVGDIQHSGTAFFYKKGNTTYLVSNYHSIKGMSPMHNRQYWKTDILYLKLIIPKTNEYQILQIDIREDVVGPTEVFYMSDGIDLFKIKIDASNLNINYINEIIAPKYFNKVPNKIIIYGYPNPLNIVKPFWSKVFKFESKFNSDGFDKFYKGTMLKMPLFNEKQKMYDLSKFYFLIDQMISGGYSGAPIIGEFENEDGEKKYYFIGVNFGNEPFSNQTWGIRGDIAINYLNG